MGFGSCEFNFCLDESFKLSKITINFSYLFKFSKITTNFFDLFKDSKNVLLKQVSYSESEAYSNLVINSVSDSESDF